MCARFEVKSQAPIDDLYVDVHVAIILDGRDPGPRLDVSAATGEAIWYPLALVWKSGESQHLLTSQPTQKWLYNIDSFYQYMGLSEN